MNLIEQLGGYEQALDLFKGCPWDSGTVDVPDPRSKGMLGLDLNVLGYELLEYRRQHNIYEVGDPIIDACIGNSVIKYHGGYDNHENWVSCFVRHATDAEIEAGKRRPELDSDTCSDIRNHVSPLTKVIDR